MSVKPDSGLDTGKARRARNPHGQGGKLRAELVAAADRILAQTGDVEALSLRGVAREVGIATPSIYLHFPDKTALVRAVLTVRFAELEAAVRTAAAAANGPAEQLRAGCLAYCHFATEHPNAYRVLFGRRPAKESISPVSREDLTSQADGEPLTPRPPLPRAGEGESNENSQAIPASDGAGQSVPSGSPSPARGRGGRGVRGAQEGTSSPVGAEAFGFLVNGVTRCMEAGLAPQADPLRVATNVWTSLHGIVTLRALGPGFPWPPLHEQVDDALRGLVGLPGQAERHNPVTAPTVDSE